MKNNHSFVAPCGVWDRPDENTTSPTVGSIASGVLLSDKMSFDCQGNGQGGSGIMNMLQLLEEKTAGSIKKADLKVIISNSATWTAGTKGVAYVNTIPSTDWSAIILIAAADYRDYDADMAIATLTSLNINYESTDDGLLYAVVISNAAINTYDASTVLTLKLVPHIN